MYSNLSGHALRRRKAARVFAVFVELSNMRTICFELQDVPPQTAARWYESMRGAVQLDKRERLQ